MIHERSPTQIITSTPTTLDRELSPLLPKTPDRKKPTIILDDLITYVSRTVSQGEDFKNGAKYAEILFSNHHFPKIDEETIREFFTQLNHERNNQNSRRDGIIPLLSIYDTSYPELREVFMQLDPPERLGAFTVLTLQERQVHKATTT